MPELFLFFKKLFAHFLEPAFSAIHYPLLKHVHSRKQAGNACKKCEWLGCIG